MQRSTQAELLEPLRAVVRAEVPQYDHIGLLIHQKPRTLNRLAWQS